MAAEENPRRSISVSQDVHAQAKLVAQRSETCSNEDAVYKGDGKQLTDMQNNDIGNPGVEAVVLEEQQGLQSDRPQARRPSHSQAAEQTGIPTEELVQAAPYKYQRLPDNGKYIRLLHLEHASDAQAPIRGALTVDLMRPELFYEALSYCWGDLSVSESIYVDGRNLAVTTNLAAALRAIRRSTEPRVLWIDAVCIEQSNIQEKNSQVGMMGAIYEQSSRTIVWLGVSDDLSREQFQRIYRNLESFSQPKVGSLKSTKYTRDQWVPFKSEKTVERPWTSRVWVVQEVAFSRTITVQCGNDQCSWRRFVQMKENEFELEAEQKRRLRFQLKSFNTARVTVQQGQRLELLQALRLFRPFNATRALDKVYAIVGLLKQPGKVDIDYANDHWETYRDVTLLVIAQTKSLDVLGDACQRDTSTRGMFWTPDWSDTAGASVPVDIDRKRHMEFRASNNHFTMPHLEADASIVLRAQFVGNVAEVGEFVREYPVGLQLLQPPFSTIVLFEQELIPTIQNWIGVACRVNGAHGTLDSSYITGETMREAFSSCLWKSEPPWTRELDLQLQTFLILCQTLLNHLSWWYKNVYLPHPMAGNILGFLFGIPYAAVYGVYWIYHAGLHVSQLRQFWASIVDRDIASKYFTAVGRTANGLLGTFPGPSAYLLDRLATIPGDSVVILEGASMPFVIRKHGDKWRLVGEAYVHGIMYGAAFQPSRCVSITIC